MAGEFYTDAEVDDMTEGLTQDAAKIRYLRRLGLRVDRKPNGRPLAWKPEQAGTPVQNGLANAGSVVVGLQQWAKDKRGQKSQGR